MDERGEMNEMETRDHDIIKQHLISIAQTEINDVDLMPDIQRQLGKRRSPTRRIITGFARMAATVVILLMFSAAGYAVWQLGGAPMTIPQDLITEIDEEQTIDGMTVQLDWAYADAHRVTVSWSAVYDASEVVGGSLLDATLMTADGTVIPEAYGGGGGGGGGDSTLVRSSSTLNFDVRMLDMATLDDTLALTLVVRYGAMPAMGGAPQGSGGGGGGGGGSSATAPTVVAPTAPASIPERTYSFDFSVPLLPARDGAVDNDTQTMTDDMTVSIRDVRVTPSMTVLTLCSALLAEGWMPTLVLDTNQDASAYTDDAVALVTPNGERVYQGSIDPQTLTDDGCAEAQIAAPFTIESSTLTVIIDGFWRPAMTIDDAMIATDIAYFEERGFDLSYEQVAPPVIDLPENVVVRPISPEALMLITINAYPSEMSVGDARYFIGVRSLQERTGEMVTFEVMVE